MKEQSQNKFYKIIKVILTFFFKILYRPTIIGSELIPSNGKVILAGNHINNLDPILLMSTTNRQIHFLAKQELFVGFKKIIFGNLGLIPVNRKVKDKNVLINAKRYLNNDEVIGIFPEGTTEKNGRYLLPFKVGAVKLSYDTKTYIVPFKIIGEYKIFKKSIKIIFDKKYMAVNDIDKSNEKLFKIIDNIKGSE